MGSPCPNLTRAAWRPHEHAAAFFSLTRRFWRSRLVQALRRHRGFLLQTADALTAAAGFDCVLNVIGGFEGDLDEHGQRGKLGGWRKAGMPWKQG